MPCELRPAQDPRKRKIDEMAQDEPQKVLCGQLRTRGRGASRLEYGHQAGPGPAWVPDLKRSTGNHNMVNPSGGPFLDPATRPAPD